MHTEQRSRCSTLPGVPAEEPSTFHQLRLRAAHFQCVWRGVLHLTVLQMRTERPSSYMQRLTVSRMYTLTPVPSLDQVYLPSSGREGWSILSRFQVTLGAVS